MNDSHIRNKNQREMLDKFSTEQSKIDEIRRTEE
jgi:hypothetical protein